MAFSETDIAFTIYYGELRISSGPHGSKVALHDLLSDFSLWPLLPALVTADNQLHLKVAHAST